ncbi:restriction endonuclease [Alicyclobacillus tolerans]|uniref:Type III restriction enzyme n=1 Tax=Alicyclobacillus tolerans TaxID=90970 RepID=A0ABT9LZY2_9BACL|nr:DEAD/DEAH box helicase family protein [Alicyclobacillus tengchongensis]MDP9729681.1 type III restriction enzyme [Alicyclobacillus tengchongensis]
MKIQFERNQQYQLDAIQSVVDIFDGQPQAAGQFETRLDAGFGGLMTELGFGNELLIDWETVVKNVKRIQTRNGINQAETYSGMDFSLEMETGTGKTYVYLRTIHELHAKYGFTKFIIVVPSVAIREGVLKNLEITREHFEDIYGRQPFDYWVYDSKLVSSLRQFATSNQLQILVINIDAFNKKTNNVIHRENDRLSGHKPIEFIQSTRPVVILDEPQNMESTQAKEAIASLNPLCTLRYSATHRKMYNLLYRLGPVKAYEMKLVKRIEVDSVIDDPDFNRPFIRVESITPTKTKITAKLTIDVQGEEGPSRKTVSVSQNGTDLFDVSNGRAAYQGYIVDHIDAGNGYIAFTNGITIYVGQAIGAHQDDVMKVQIQETIKEHLEKELRVYKEFPEGKRLKVLSLFFIDRVANYAEADGKIRKWFEEAYTELAQKPRYAVLELPPVEVVHNGYFATDRKGMAKDTSGNTQADDEAYELIMKHKERLLSREEPLRFIFSHSALREGWDNPNVFQICTLNETRSEIKKRQEIGRGLRLPVDETGQRIIDHPVNRLTVIANESYDDFARSLQTEIEDETGDKFPKPDNKRERRIVRRREDLRDNKDFVELWNRIKHKTRYTVEYDTNVLIDRAAEAIKSMPAVAAPSLHAVKSGIDITEQGVSTELLSVRQESVTPSGQVPDLIGYIQRQTELTRGTIAEILIRSERLNDVFVNPQQFLDFATRAIRETLQHLMIEGIKYELTGQEYEMLKKFKEDDGGFEEELNLYESRLVKVNKSVYDHIEVDSNVELEFAKGLDSRKDIRFFVKLPGWFKIETPVGSYNPDWAIVKQSENEGTKLYLVRETKGSTYLGDLRDSEQAKIRCGEAHFGKLGVDYRVAKSAAEV